MTYEEQRAALEALVVDWAIKEDKNVKGPFTSGDFVTWELNRIFGPGYWSVHMIEGPTLVKVNESSCYFRVVGSLIVEFANGQVSRQDDIGIWPLIAAKGKKLEDTAVDLFRTAEMAARTALLKNAAGNLGTSFKPLSDLELEYEIKRAISKETFAEEGDAPASKHIDDLYGEEQPASDEQHKAIAALLVKIGVTTKKGQRAAIKKAGFDFDKLTYSQAGEIIRRLSDKAAKKEKGN